MKESGRDAPQTNKSANKAPNIYDDINMDVELILRAYHVSREDLKNRPATRKIRIITTG